MNKNTTYNNDTMKVLPTFPDNSVNLYYTDTPYNMGSEYRIDDKGHIVFVGKGSDFMNKWEAMDGYWWDRYFKEVARTLKYGGYWISHNIDRQSWLWCYYAVKNGLLPMQKLYWLFVSSMPKGVDITKQIDSLLGQDRVVVGTKKGAQKISTGVYGSWGQNSNEDGSYNVTIPTSTIAQKYDGYMYGIAGLKQMMEEILVFQKRPLDTIPKDIIAYERGDKRIHPSVFNIKSTQPKSRYDGQLRHTPQLLIYDEMKPMLLNNTSIVPIEAAKLTEVCPVIKFEQDDLIPYFFEPKANKEEKDEGLDEFELVQVTDGRKFVNPNQARQAGMKTKKKNPHPSPKPKRLVKWVLDLFKPPDQILVVDTFAGSGVIPQCCKEMGIDYVGIEIDPIYFKVVEAKLNYADEKKGLFD